MDNSKRKIAVLFLAVSIFIAAFFYVYNIYKKEGEKRSVFVESPSAKADHLEVSAYIVSIDPVKGDMTVRLSFLPKGNLADERGFLKEEIDLYVNSSVGKQDYSFPKDKLINPVDVTLSLYDGSVTDYPLDLHKAELILMTVAKERKSDGTSEQVEIGIDNVVTFSGSVTGYKIDAELEKQSGEAYTMLEIDIERSASVKFFSFFVIITMWILVVMMIYLLFSIVIKGKKVEPTFFAFASSMLFAFPAFRNMMPFSPPIGAFPDYIAFFWAEAAAALTLVGLILTWILRKPAN